MAQMAPAASLDWPQREPCNNLSDQIIGTTSQANILLDSIARAAGWGSLIQVNQASVLNFITNVQRLCEMVPDSDSAGLHAGTNPLNQPAEPHSSGQQDLVRTLAEIKSLKEVMDRKVAAVEAAIGPANESFNGHQAVAPHSGSLSSPKPIGSHHLMPDRLVPLGDSLIESNIHPSASQAANEPMSASRSHSRSTTGQTAAAPSSSNKASESTERVEPDSKSRSTDDRINADSTVRASDSAFATPLPPEDNDGSDNQAGDDDDGTDDEDSDAENSSSNEDTGMEDTEISEQSDESGATEPEPIDAWRERITKPASIGVPKSIRAVSPSTTIPAPPIKKRSGWLRIRISIPDHRIKSELKQLPQPGLNVA
ncbi:hypothetical protein XANCAGTX0491_006101 [Xanthoria calcicola]